MRRSELALIAALLALHAVASLRLLVPAHFIIDECTYHAMVQSLAERGALDFWNGYEEFPSAELLAAAVEPAGGRLYPVTPVLYAVIALPFYRLAGFTGLFLLSNLAFLGSLALTASLAWQLFRDRGLALLAVLVLALASYFWEYSQAVWPHALASCAILGAFAAALRGLAAERPAASFAWCLLAGAVIGLGIGVRLDVAFAAACLALPCGLARGRRVAALLGLALGSLPALLVLCFSNQLKWGVFTPFSYGALHTAGHAWSAYLPLAALGAAGVAGLLAARSPGRGRPLVVLAGLALLAGTLLVPELRGWLAEWARGAYQLLVDLRGYDPGAPLPALSRSGGGGLVYFGHLKKSLLQSCPYLGLLVLPAAALLRDAQQRGRLALLFLVPVVYVAVFSAFRWEFGGMVLHQRYLLPILPFTSILTAWSLRALFRGAGPRARAAAWTAGGVSAAAYAALVSLRTGSVDEAEVVYLSAPLLLAAVTLLLTLGCVARGSLAPAVRLAAVCGLVWAGLVALLYDYPGSRWLRSYNAELGGRAAQVVAADSILFTTHPDPFCALFERPRVRLALPPRDGFRDFRPLVDFHLAHGRAVYAAFPEALWRRAERRGWLDGLAVEDLFTHPVFRMGRLVRADAGRSRAPAREDGDDVEEVHGHRKPAAGKAGSRPGAMQQGLAQPLHQVAQRVDGRLGPQALDAQAVVREQPP